MPLILLGVFFSSSSIFGQSCAEALGQANTFYAEGNFDDLDRLVNTTSTDFYKCLNNEKGITFSDADMVSAKRLITLSHIYQDRKPDSEQAMIELLKEDPEHPLDSALDPGEFIYLYSQFRKDPIFRVGARVGVTYSTINLIDEFGVENLNDPLGSTFSARIGISAGLYIDYNVWDNLEISLGAGFSSRSVEYNNDLFPGGSNSGDQADQTDVVFSPTGYIDTYSFIDVPLVAKYNFELNEKKLVIYPYGGVIGNLLLSASRSGARVSTNPGSIDLKNVGLREELNYTYTAGIGVKLRNNTDYITIEIGANKGGNNFVVPERRYRNQDLVFRLAQVDGNGGLDFLSFKVGFQKSIYNPKKLKEFREN
ncbi:MAG: outer membrane beta-barrel protein [Cyclobacteriaceae bacterium]